MIIKIGRHGFCMADDCAVRSVTLNVSSQEELEEFLRSYLPYAYRNENWVWAIYKEDCKDDHLSYSIFLYYYLTPIVQYFVSPENPPILEDGDWLSCSLITSKLAGSYKDFPKEGNFLHRVRQYVEEQKNKI